MGYSTTSFQGTQLYSGAVSFKIRGRHLIELVAEYIDVQLPVSVILKFISLFREYSSSRNNVPIQWNTRHVVSSGHIYNYQCPKPVIALKEDWIRKES